ncbi:dihydroorotate dehydrogenase [candidate division MSBL1 archaeon SCGC-AAA259I09]|uniref:Dihydroorotate dehydrogenase n=2 Tax=candidate division MSBL1 TaxID=215777 RepID=A0A133UVH5_9EURY|nr:dihydroorotate dehydrogenase [candidate division MSBL1 archaeon SCGC-AAA259I09]KXB00817.1 dihydroorotate dehydrogenase [candidate division MSBL1 archaeon SCGC-AAA259M10]
MTKEKLKVTIGTIEIKNPTILAAGILGQTGANLKRVLRSGAGAVVTKSIGPKPREGYSGPNIVQTPCGLLNAMGLPNPGMENMVEEIETVKEKGGTVIGSIFGEGLEEFKKLSRKMEEAGVDAVELNLSCPHAKKLSTIGNDPEMAERITKGVSKESDAPIWTKLPGNTNISNLLEVAQSVQKAGADAITIANTFPGMAIDARAERPVLGHETGGLSGPAIKPIALRLIYEVYKKVDIPIIGSGGVMNGEDMIEYLLAGASAVEIGTGIMWRDIDIFEKVCEEALPYLEDRSVTKLIGSAH